MTERQRRVNKGIMVLGVDGMDPRYTRYMVDQGKMPYMAEYIKRGACREDLVLLGGHPTITPPMWTTLATGCYVNVHGITGFYRQHPEDLSAVCYALDSRDCKAEQIWNVTAENGIKTLVFHWPGSSWPPSSDSENLFVADGTSPGAMGMATSQTEADSIFGASDKVTEPKFMSKVDPHAVAMCVVEELPDRSTNLGYDFAEAQTTGLDKMSICQDWDPTSATSPRINLAQSYIREPQGWAFEIPADAKETVVLMSRGLLRRPALLLKNEAGIYDTFVLYKSKKSEEVLVTLKVGETKGNIYDEGFDKHDEKHDVVRNMKLLAMAEDGSNMKMWISAAMNVNVYDTWSPQRVYDYVKETCGPTPPTANIYEQTEELHQCMLSGWEIACDWQSKAIHEIVKREGIELVMSHMHIDDLVDHTFIHNLSKQVADGMLAAGLTEVTHEDYKRWQEELYVVTDNYLGSFMHYLDEGWTIIITSDHAQIASTLFTDSQLGTVNGYTARLFQKWGYLDFLHDENGNEIEEIDWSVTKAIPNRSMDIWINLKGRNKHVQSDGTVVEGLIDPEDKYEFEEEIMTKLYELKNRAGKRYIALALRNKDAVHIGLGGPESGDIVYVLSEMNNQHHGDSLSTAMGEEHTSVSPIFVAAGPGFQSGVYTDRVIRQIDVAPTISALFGVRFPAQAEGAPAYQILDWEF
ncbi:MAG: alkaline phosphatase family protein [Peptococcaceae bacterium]|nr:alkaline phosphatase family protein [Peptococcaceae bacterium]